MGLIQKHRAAPKADVEAVSGGKLGLQGLIVLKIDEILLEVRQGHLVHGPGGQIDLAVALLADGLAVDLCGQQPGRRIAADRQSFLLLLNNPIVILLFLYICPMGQKKEHLVKGGQRVPTLPPPEKPPPPPREAKPPLPPLRAA